jgi:CheY-like chemotaxis protein
MGGCGAILVAEDNSDDVALLEQAFLQAGLSAPLRFVRDGQETIEYLEGRPPFNDRTDYPLPNLLLVDLKMPRLDGFELLDWLHHQRPTNQMLVGVLSGVDDPLAVERTYGLGAKFHVAKPNRFEDLVSIAGFLIHASGANSNEAAAFATTPEVLAAMRQSQTILPIHLRQSAV